MEKAKKAIANFISQDGKHHTIVDEVVRPVVVDEHRYTTRHEDIVTAVDKEIHQDHYQTVIQPVISKEVLPEKHSHNAVAVERKVFKHGDERELEATLKKDVDTYKDRSFTHEATHSSSTAPMVSGEHTHHHVHHHIQPVIQKEIVQPEYVHTTIPVHETHHAAAIHHEVTTLPPKTLEEYKAARGSFDAIATPRIINEFDGCPSVKDKGAASGNQATALHGSESITSEIKQAVNGVKNEMKDARANKQAVNGRS